MLKHLTRLRLIQLWAAAVIVAAAVSATFGGTIPSVGSAMLLIALSLAPAMHGRGAANNPAMIPGGLEPRSQPPAVQTGIPPGPSGPHPLPAATHDPRRVERPRDGGGAPGARPYRPSPFDWLQRVLLRLTEWFIRLMATSPSTR